jgi:hypothetical protein
MVLLASMPPAKSTPNKGELERWWGLLKVALGNHSLPPIASPCLPHAQVWSPPNPNCFLINDETIDDLLTFPGLFGRGKDNM